MHRTLIKALVEKGKSTDMEMLKDLMVEMIDDIKVYDYDEYKKIEYKMYTMLYGDHLNEELARKWVSCMENKDGTMGEHWTYEQTSQYAGKFDKWDWYAVLNMQYSDYFNPRFDTNTYVELAKDWLNDKDGRKCKTLNYYWFVAKD